MKVLKKIQQKAKSPRVNEVISTLEYIKEELNRLDDNLGNSTKRYFNIYQSLSSLGAPVELDRLYQTDMYYALGKQKMTISEKIQDQLKCVLEVLNYLVPQQEIENLIQFKAKFIERYGEEEVPLLSVLDSETGIGYGQNSGSSGDLNPLVSDLILPNENEKEPRLKWSPIQSFLLKKLSVALKKDKKVVRIGLDDVKSLKKNGYQDLPSTFFVKFKHLSKKNGLDYLKLDAIAGSSGINLLGRFASSNSKIEELVRDIAKYEQDKNPEVIIAEVLHLPESRVGNILMRPSFRDYEIAYLNKSRLKHDQQIMIKDIVVSVQGGRIVLRSRTNKKIIIPRLGNAHNFTANSMPVYHFLCDLQSEGVRGSLGFNWGVLSGEYQFLPRVEINNVVVFPATWHLKNTDFKEVCANPSLIMEWRKKWGIPSKVLLVDGDNELYLNLEDELSKRMFFSVIKRRNSIKLVEFLFDPLKTVVKDEKNRSYTNEFIAIVKNDHFSFNENSSKASIVVSDKVVHQFKLGSEWLYYKIYSGTKTADSILTNIIEPLIEKLDKQKLISSWFFIRYSDPEHHLRVRFCLSDSKYLGSVIQLFNEAIFDYEKEGLVWSVKNDSYERENTRYGSNSIHIAEQLFSLESNCVLQILNLINGDDGEEIRWRIAIRAVDELINGFNYSLEKKCELMENLKTGFAKEFGMNKSLKMQMDKKFRKNRSLIVQILNWKKEEYSEYQEIFEVLSENRKASVPLINEILEMELKKELRVNLNDLLASFIHMLLNRLFRNKQRLNEMVIYDFLWRSYRSELAKKHFKLKAKVG